MIVRKAVSDTQLKMRQALCFRSLKSSVVMRETEALKRHQLHFPLPKLRVNRMSP